MLINYDALQTLTLVLSYMIIYNLTAFVLFSTIGQLVNAHIKTLYSFSELGSTNILAKIISLAILSMAGVPPLLGFFSKIFVFVLLANSSFFLLFPPFFVLLFVGLYFYVQNLRFLNGTSASDTAMPSELNSRPSYVYYTLILPTLFFIIFGSMFVDDLFILVSWLLL